MSDPVSNADIEDVLSSIRRLVSEDPVGVKERRPAEPEAAVERFVLTPAFRVVDGNRAANDAPQEDTGADHDAIAEVTTSDPQVSEVFETDTEWHEDSAERAIDLGQHAEETASHHNAPEELTLEARIAELEAAIEQAPQEWEPDGSEDGSSDETRPLSFDTDADSAQIADAVASEDDLTEAEEDSDAAVLEQSEAQGGGVADATQADVEAFFTEAEEETVSEASEEKTAELDVDTKAEPDEWQDVEAEVGFAADAPDPLHAELAGAVSAEARRTLQEPLTQDTTRDSAPEIEAEAKAIDQDEAGVQPSDDDDDGFGNFLADDETTIDEEALREIVSELVREELQGVLGERITRNVRRLVRREIQRAMAMRDLE